MVKIRPTLHINDAECQDKTMIMSAVTGHFTKSVKFEAFNCSENLSF